MPDREKLFVRQIGVGKPVLILSGLGMSSWQWLPFIYPSLKTRRFIIPDYRGFGGSKHCKVPQQLNAIESHWLDIQHLLPQLNLPQQIDVIGYSMGATTTMHGLKYGQFSQRISRYLHIDQTAKIKNDDTWAFGLLGSQQQQFLNLLTRIIDLLKPYNNHQYVAKLPKAVQKQLIQLWLELMSLQNPDSHITTILKKFPIHNIQVQTLPLKSIQYTLWYLATYIEHNEDYRSSLIQLDKPTEFIIGKQSSLYHYDGQLHIAQQLPQSKIHLLDQSGHVPLLSEPAKFRRILNSFLSKP